MTDHDRFCVLANGTRSGDERLSYKAHINRPSATSKETTGELIKHPPQWTHQREPLLNEAYSQLVIEKWIFSFSNSSIWSTPKARAVTPRGSPLTEVRTTHLDRTNPDRLHTA